MKIKSLLFAAAMSLVLVGCKTAETPSWSKQDKDMFNEYIYGEVLPYFSNAGKLTVAYDDEEEAIAIISEKTTTSQKLESYLKKYSEKKGWEQLRTSQLYTYAFEKCVFADEGERYVCASICLTDEDGYIADEEGYLSIYAYDPYVYSFPTDYLNDAVAYYFGETEVSVPAVSASRYSCDDVDVQCYDVDPEALNAFLAALPESGFDLFPETLVDDYGYRIAVSLDGVYSVTFKYFADDAVLDLYLDGPFQKQWTDVDLALTSLFTKYAEFGSTYFLVPSFDSTLYRVIDGPYNETYIYFEMYEYVEAIVSVFNVDSSCISTYSSQLGGSGWELDSEDDYIYATKTIGTLTRELEVEFDGVDVMTITVYLIGLSGEGE